MFLDSSAYCWRLCRWDNFYVSLLFENVVVYRNQPDNFSFYYHLYFVELSLLYIFIFQLIFFQLICSYVFMPFSVLMGVSWDDSFEVGKLLGLKTFLNEFVAYESLAKLIKNRRQGLPGAKLEVMLNSISHLMQMFICCYCCQIVQDILHL